MKFNGFGPDLYLMKKPDWEENVGKRHAASVFVYRLGVRGENVRCQRILRFTRGGMMMGKTKENCRSSVSMI